MDTILGLFVISAVASSFITTIQATILYPFGASVGDITLPKEDDDSTLVDIDINFPFFDQNHRSLFINTNGIISFIENVLEFTPERFPLGNNRRVVAPYWADVDTSSVNGGDIWYHQINNATQLQDVTDEIMRVFAVDFALQPFVATWALFVTWSNVTFYDKHSIFFEGQPKNTFQAVLLTDGVHSFTIFNYGKIEWTTGASSGGDKHTGLASTADAVAAQVGFNAGDNKNFYSVPYSGTNGILQITETTNVGRPGSEGRWMFRIDNKEIEVPGCDTISTQDKSNVVLQISPEQVSMLGGDVLTISGPCFNSSSNCYCRMDGHLIQASYDFKQDPFTVRCPTPIFLKIGSIDVDLSLNGGRTFDYSGLVTAVGLERQTPRVEISDTSTTLIKVNINPVNFPDQLSTPESTRVDVFIYSYQENKQTGEVVLKPETAIKRNFQLSQTTFLDTKRLLGSVDVALLRVVVTGMVDESGEAKWVNGQLLSKGNTQPIASLWSIPYLANDDKQTSAREWCQRWSKRESILSIRSDNVASCPCTFQQATADRGRFEPDPWCNLAKNGLKRNCQYRLSAKHCVRAAVPSNKGRGQLCCYDNDNNLLLLNDTPEGGFVQSSHHGGFWPITQPGTVPYLSNFYRDHLPWDQCCARAGSEKSCDLFRERRPSDDCKSYQPPKVATVFGDPHFVTFDGTNYTFNGFGEFTLVSVDTPEVLLQARMAETVNDVSATGVIALVMKMSGSDVVQVELNERRVVDTWVKRNNVQIWSRLAFDQSAWWDAEGVTVEQLTSGSNIAILVTLDSGLAVTLTVAENVNAMSIIIIAPPTVKGMTRGLMGTWNGNSTDDIQTPASEIIDHEDPDMLHSSYGLTWAVNWNDSLFRYDIGINHTTVNKLAFVPSFEPNSTTVQEQRLGEVCGDSQTCRYDYHKTYNEMRAKKTKDAEDRFTKTHMSTIPVPACGYLAPPTNGNKAGTVYINGSSISFKCNKQYQLAGSAQRMCISGIWSGNTTTCEIIKDDTTLQIIVIAAVIGGMLILALCFLCLICLCWRRKKSKKKHDQEEMGSLKNLTHPVHPSTANGHIAVAHTQSVSDRSLQTTPAEQRRVASEYTDGRVRVASLIENSDIEDDLCINMNNRRSIPDPRGLPAEKMAQENDYDDPSKMRSLENHTNPARASTASDSDSDRSLRMTPEVQRRVANEYTDGQVRVASLIENSDIEDDLCLNMYNRRSIPNSNTKYKQDSVGPPLKEYPEKMTQENDYVDPIAARTGETRMRPHPSTTDDQCRVANEFTDGRLKVASLIENSDIEEDLYINLNNRRSLTEFRTEDKQKLASLGPSRKRPVSLLLPAAAQNYSHVFRPSSSRISAGADAKSPMTEEDKLRKAGLLGPAPKQYPEKAAQENDYANSMSVRRGKTRVPSNRMR